MDHMRAPPRAAASGPPGVRGHLGLARPPREGHVHGGVLVAVDLPQQAPRLGARVEGLPRVVAVLLFVGLVRPSETGHGRVAERLHNVYLLKKKGSLFPRETNETFEML